MIIQKLINSTEDIQHYKKVKDPPRRSWTIFSEFSELVNDIRKSDSMNTLGKLFADGAYMMAIIFSDVWQTMEFCLVLKYEKFKN